MVVQELSLSWRWETYPSFTTKKINKNVHVYFLDMEKKMWGKNWSIVHLGLFITKNNHINQENKLDYFLIAFLYSNVPREGLRCPRSNVSIVFIERKSILCFINPINDKKLIVSLICRDLHFTQCSLWGDVIGSTANSTIQCTYNRKWGYSEMQSILIM